MGDNTSVQLSSRHVKIIKAKFSVGPDAFKYQLCLDSNTISWSVEWILIDPDLEAVVPGLSTMVRYIFCTSGIITGTEYITSAGDESMYPFRYSPHKRKFPISIVFGSELVCIGAFWILLADKINWVVFGSWKVGEKMASIIHKGPRRFACCGPCQKFWVSRFLQALQAWDNAEIWHEHAKSRRKVKSLSAQKHYHDFIVAIYDRMYTNPFILSARAYGLVFDNVREVVPTMQFKFVNAKAPFDWYVVE